MSVELDFFIDLFELICVIIVFSIFVIRSRWFSDAVKRRYTWKNQAVLIVFFGLLSIYGTLGGLSILGEPLNVGDIGPMLGGLFCGPYVGIGAGLIGAALISATGGTTSLPCSIAAVLSGLFAGLVYLLLKKDFAGVKIAVVFAVAMESLQMLIILAMVKPPEIAFEIVSFAAIPMIIANVIGILIFSYLFRNLLEEKKTINERDQYEKEVAKNRAELEIASEIQTNFLPGAIPEIPGFSIFALSRPAKEVGGDFYDFIDCGGEETGIVIADVSGKGVPAALFMVLSKTLMNASAGWNRSIKKAMEDANNLILAESGAGMFVTLFYMRLNHSSKKIEYANAGHCPPLYLGASDNDFLPLNPTGMALGVLEDNKYGAGEISTSSGDLIVFFTDGITESINTREEEFGEERLKEIIMNNRHKKPDEIADLIIESVDLHSAGNPQFDDITLIILKVL
ncbi:protein serine/threonine phosphatase [Methanolacinia petrolearia DSM 11571]|uniref:Protein serine/threonine phosphatase n=1 Tax=Methanolacinia petrolearia (strain DSM 11571 / OCM 486 / SEBR 4847) TaxID=679926 RepID=E1RJS3_METP4|nr:SpoIIE family protein phosphatase [Methanolacinia petrolearia]ADN35720.1 protein serine/threonine phosphatase [Methanolacinia petrolearia DSM 11571]